MGSCPPSYASLWDLYLYQATPQGWKNLLAYFSSPWEGRVSSTVPSKTTSRNPWSVVLLSLQALASSRMRQSFLLLIFFTFIEVEFTWCFIMQWFKILIHWHEHNRCVHSHHPIRLRNIFLPLRDMVLPSFCFLSLSFMFSGYFVSAKHVLWFG